MKQPMFHDVKIAGKRNHWHAVRCLWLILLCALPLAAQEKLRVIVETDAGGDPDDEQSLVRFLVYTNEWDVDGIIANRPVAREKENRNPDTREGTTHRDHMLARWAVDLQNDFRARMDWCVKPRREANHEPVVVLDADRTQAVLRRTARAGIELPLQVPNPMIDAGEVLPGFNDDFTGKAPDLGAFEVGRPPLQFGRRAYLKPNDDWAPWERF